jgi:hypothetical protein
MTALGRIQPHILANSKILQIGSSRRSPAVFLGGAAGTRTQDRRIMSPLL